MTGTGSGPVPATAEALDRIAASLDELAAVLARLRRTDMPQDQALAWFKLAQSGDRLAVTADRVLFEPGHRVNLIRVARNAAAAADESSADAPLVPPLRRAERSP